jgi:hypothetical protein
VTAWKRLIHFPGSFLFHILSLKTCSRSNHHQSVAVRPAFGAHAAAWHDAKFLRKQIKTTAPAAK